MKGFKKWVLKNEFNFSLIRLQNMLNEENRKNLAKLTSIGVVFL